MNRTFLQMQELEEASKILSEEQYNVLLTASFNYMQLNVLKKALAEGIEVEKIRKIAKKWISYQEMEELISEIKAEERLIIPYKRKSLNLLILSFILLSMVFSASFISLFVYSDNLEIRLSTDVITLNCGEKFTPQLYLESYTQREDAMLVLPEQFIEEKPCTRIADYELITEDRKVRKLLTVNYVDQKAPNITLKKNTVEHLKGAPFSCRIYIESADDNCDGELTNEVVCSDKLTDFEYQDITYQVKDSSGNTATVILNLHLIDPVASEQHEEAVVSRQATETGYVTDSAAQLEVSIPQTVQEDVEYEEIIEEKVTAIETSETIITFNW